MNGKMSAKVYDISGSATAVGREPIVCVELIDSVNGNALVAQRYLKVKWTMEGKDLAVPFNPVSVSYTHLDVYKRQDGDGEPSYPRRPDRSARRR